MSDTDARTTGILLMTFTVVNLAVVILLGAVFGWPAVLDEPAATALAAFDAARAPIVAGFVLFTLLSVALVPISIGLHLLVAERRPAGLWLASVTVFGVLGGLAQTLGWIRWPLVVPGLADTYLDPATSPELRAATEASYELLNSYAGGALGECLGWLFQALWAFGVAVLLLRAGIVGRRTALAGLAMTAVWALAFLVGPAVPALVDGPLGTVSFVAYGGWFFWLGAVGIVLLRAVPARTPAPVGAR